MRRSKLTFERFGAGGFRHRLLCCQTTEKTAASRGDLDALNQALSKSLPEQGGCHPDRPMCQASCRTLGPGTKTTARHWGGKEEPL